MFDIHCHILNGVDDGSRTPAESHQMLLAARDAGIDHIVCTPHCKHSDFDAELIAKRYRAFKAHAEKNGVRLSLGYEVHWKKLADMGLDAAPSLCIEGTNLLLLEFSNSHLPANWQRAIYAIQGKGVDDGSRTPAESHQMLLAARDAGIDHIVCTPHCKHSDFDAELIAKRYRAFKAHAEKNGVRLSLGYEVHWKKLADMGLDAAPSLCIEGTNLLLLEFSNSHLPANWQRAIYAIQGKGVDIVIAHPERYKPVQEDIDVAREMREMGCRLQLSANFVEGGIFSPRRRTATALLKNGLVDYLASDAHRVEHYATYLKALKEAQKY